MKISRFQALDYFVRKELISFMWPNTLASVDDETVLNVAKHEDRILLTLDRDHGELIFTRRIQAPRGVVYFRMQDYRPTELGESLMAMIIDGFIFDGYFTVITSKGLRQRRL